ncbi:MAG: PSD1 and planctomycete cytochrome C domain-containing protein, partial [Isosphaerales bacterium]
GSGPAIVPGDLEASLLFQAIRGADGVEPMPPKGKLPPEIVADFGRWIKMGAPDPRQGQTDTLATSTSTSTSVSADARDWWSLRPIRRPATPTALPARPAWAINPIDVFILAKLKEQGLEPSPEADRRTLIRRLSFDLTGLPPAPEELHRFLNDPSPAAYEQLVDRLLASPHHGERWARHWMDLVHFAETHGHDQDRIRPHAWPYRDYLIHSFNHDTPYARFVAEQVAADALFPDEPGLVVALGMLAAGPWDESSLRDIRDDSIDRQIGHYIDRDDMVSTVMSTFVSATVHCARCHDHKFDPISQEDYYSLQAVFAGTDKAERGYDADPAIDRLRRTLAAELKQTERRDPAQAGWLKAELAALPPQSLVFAGASEFLPDAGHKPPGAPRPVWILTRGDIHTPARPAVPGTLACVAGLETRFPVSPGDDESVRRARLVRWIVDPKNPLTWRSIVNRAWHHHFGRGLVATPNDFGRMGAAPSHPELLDWLASTFIESGGSLKRLHRLIVTSAVYRQSVQHQPDFAAKDADNQWLWRQNRRRLDAESVYDAILAVAGRLDPTMSGPSVRQFSLRPGVHVTPVIDYSQYDWNSPGSCRRSVYRFLFRTLPDPFFDSLDSADASQLTAVRNESTTPLQALELLNNPFVIHQSEAFARRLERAAARVDLQVRLAFELAYGREATTDEVEFLSGYAGRHGLANLCRLIVNSNEFLFVN